MNFKRVLILASFGILLALTGAVLADFYIARTSPIPSRAYNALTGANASVLFAMDPGESLDYGGETLHGYKVLGQTRLGLIKSIVVSEVLKWTTSKGQAPLCALAPRHGIRVVDQGHRYDFIICYSCGQVAIFENGTQLGLLSISRIPMGIFDFLLTADHVPVTVDRVSPAVAAEWERRHLDLVAKRRKSDEASVVEWEKAMPDSIKNIWNPKNHLQHFTIEIDQFDSVLKTEYPNKKDRISALLNWLGADSGMWSRFESPLFYDEQVPERILLNYPIDDICSMIDSGTLDRQQVSGAARYFADRFGPFLQNDRSELKRFQHQCPEARRILLDNVRKFGDPNDLEIAERYFGSP